MEKLMKSIYLSNISSDAWKRLIEKYDDAIDFVHSSKKKGHLKELDFFWRNEFKTSVFSRSPGYFTLEELSKIVKWKLNRGKMRPLQKLVDSNCSSKVEEISKVTVELLQTGDWKGAMEQLIQLKGVGPATASALLAPLSPENCPFMADEVLEVVSPTGSREYTMKAYIHMREQLINKASSLNLTAEDIGMALWTYNIHLQHNIDLLKDLELINGINVSKSSKSSEVINSSEINELSQKSNDAKSSSVKSRKRKSTE